MNVKQVIIWRSDLNCRQGKKMAQAGHAACAHFMQRIKYGLSADGKMTCFSLTEYELAWINGNYRKIVLQVKNEEELLLLYKKAQDIGLPVQLITDSGLTEFDGPTNTCIVIGPHTDEEINRVTGNGGPLGALKLF